MENTNKKTSVADIINVYKEATSGGAQKDKPTEAPTESPSPKTSIDTYEKQLTRETDTDLMTSYEVIHLPSKGLFYKNGLKELEVEYMTSKDEDLLTTPSLIENETVINKLLKRKIKTPNIDINDLLPGDKSAVILFLRTSSYGSDYTVEVQDPRTGEYFKEKVDLLKLRAKEIKQLPDEDGCFTVELPMRKKTVKFRLLTSGEEENVRKTAESVSKEYNEGFPQYSTFRLKTAVVSIGGNTDKSYINKFIDAMPAKDSLTIKKKINEVSPEYDMNYEFTTQDGYKFNAYLMVGADFFFPND